MNLWTRVQSKIKRNVHTAHKHHLVPIVSGKKYHLGIILTAIAWILIAQYTSILEKASQHQPANLAERMTRFGMLMCIINFTMVVLYSFFLFFGKKGYYRCKNPKGVIARGCGSFISFLTFSLAKIGTDSIDNTILYSLDPFWILMIMAYVGIFIPKTQRVMIIFAIITMLFVLREDLSNHSLISWISGTISGQTLAIITIMTSYLIKKDPPLRIGFYNGVIGLIGSVIFTLISLLFSGFIKISTFDIFSMIYSGAIFSIALFCFLESFYYTEAYIISVTSLVLPIFMIWNGWLIDVSTFKLDSLIGTSIAGVVTLYVFFAEYYEAKKRDHMVDGYIEGKEK